MPSEMILSHARIVTDTEVFLGTVVIKNGMIVEVSQGTSRLPQAINLEGRYLLPGLVELHTDNLEKYMMPRPGVFWPPHSAIISHDAQMVSSGITTVLDALSIGDISPGQKRLHNLKPMLEAIDNFSTENLNRADHYLHLRCEVGHPDTLNTFLEISNHQRVKLVSLMDHAPGQRQFTDLEQYRLYYQGKYDLTNQQMADFTKQQKENAALYSASHRDSISQYCRSNNLPMASHDDATVAHVQESATLGMVIAEFPTTDAAAATSHQHGLKVMMGAPNIVRGRSHSGNIAASTLADKGMLDILSSDYYPSSLLHAALNLTHHHSNYSLPAAIRTISKAPAQSANFTDRGEIKIGLRADLIEMQLINNHPVIQQVWRKGLRVF